MRSQRLDNTGKAAGMHVETVRGDLTAESVDAIVNAANEQLSPGGGVCGAIHAAGGPSIAAECRRIGHCPTGGAVATTAGNLPARFVIHAVGPVWHGGGANEDELLAACYRTALDLAAASNLTSIAFPAISTGIYSFPADRAARIAVGTVAKELPARPTITRVVFCCFSEQSAEHHIDAARELKLA